MEMPIKLILSILRRIQRVLLFGKITVKSISTPSLCCFPSLFTSIDLLNKIDKTKKTQLRGNSFVRLHNIDRTKIHRKL